MVRVVLRSGDEPGADGNPTKASTLTISPNASASPVVLLHSGGMSGRQWRKLAEALGQRHRVITPDFIGSGEQPPWPENEPFHFSQDVDRIDGVLRALGEPVHLVGHSYGGFVALMMAKRAPTLLRSITAYDPVAFGVLHAENDAEGLDDLARAANNPVFTNEATGGDDAWFEAFVDYWNGTGTWRGMPQAARDAFLRVGRKVYWEVATLMEERTGADAYGDLDPPALFVTGDRSPAAARRVVTLLAAAFPHGRALILEGAGHMGPISHGAVFNPAVVEAIARAEASR